jgi:hypothetical protein
MKYRRSQVKNLTIAVTEKPRDGDPDLVGYVSVAFLITIREKDFICWVFFKQLLLKLFSKSEISWR